MAPTDLSDIETRVNADGLCVLGGFHPVLSDDLKGTETVVLIGPREPDFWEVVTASEEFSDGRPDPIDRWTVRIFSRLAEDLGCSAVFPFGGPPWRPFLSWAVRTGEAWPSPAGLLVHARAGLWLSYRGALALRQRIPLPEPSTRPCDDCSQPCLSACPVNALGPGGYDTAACHAYLGTPAGQDCMQRGCRARRACPVGQAYGRVDEQSAHHMRHFHP